MDRSSAGSRADGERGDRVVEITEVADEYVTEDDNSSLGGSEADPEDQQLLPFSADSETYAERIYALKDMIPPTTRDALASALSTTTSYVRKTANLAGNAAWILTTSALLVGLPLMLSIEGEAGLVQQETEFNLQNQQQPVSPSFPLLSTTRSDPTSFISHPPFSSTTTLQRRQRYDDNATTTTLRRQRYDDNATTMRDDHRTPLQLKRLKRRRVEQPSQQDSNREHLRPCIKCIISLPIHTLSSSHRIQRAEAR